MAKHFCMNCGKEFEAANNMVRYCPECAAQKKEEQKQKQKGYAKERTARLGLTNVSIYKTDKETLQKMAKDKGVTMADIVKSILEGLATTEEPDKPTEKPKAKDGKKKA